MVRQPTYENSDATSPSARTQFGLRHVMLLIASAAIVLAAVTQFGDGGIPVASAIAIVLVGSWWSWYSNKCEPLFASVFVSLLALALWPTMLVNRVGPRRLTCQNNVRHLVLALHSYADANNGEFPPAYLADKDGKPMHSWRILILPYIEEDRLYHQYRFEEPWDSPHNLTIAQQIPSVFQCPSVIQNGRSAFTSYVAVTGAETMWPGAESMSLDRITDGTANTLCLIEWPDCDVIWTEPRDLPSDRLILLTQPSAKQLHHAGLIAAMADTSSRTLVIPQLNDTEIDALVTRAADDNADLSSQ